MLAYFFLVNCCIFGLLWEMFEGEFDGQFIFFCEVWAALNKLLRGYEPWQPPSSDGRHEEKKYIYAPFVALCAGTKKVLVIINEN